MRWLLAAVLSVVALHAGAQERRYAYEADLERPLRAGELSAGGIAWRCKDGRCTAQERGGRVSVTGCTELARAVGPLRRYASELRTLSADELARCNAAAAPAKPSAKTVAPSWRATAPELTYTGVAGTTEEQR